MAYKVGTTTVIDDNGKVDWSRVKNKPADLSTSVTVASGTNCSSYGSLSVSRSGTTVTYSVAASASNCVNCPGTTDCNCNGI